MIVGLILVILAAVSVHVRRFINEAAMFVVCVLVWTLMWVAVMLESSRRVWRLVGVGALAVVLVTWWKSGELVIHLIRHLP
jgi:hypothetical protein